MPDTTVETAPFNYNYRWGLNNGYACLLSDLWSLRTCKRLGDWNFSIPKKSINNWHQQHSGARYSDLACVILNLFVKLSYEWFQNESMNDPNLSVWGPISRPKDFQSEFCASHGWNKTMRFHNMSFQTGFKSGLRLPVSWLPIHSTYLRTCLNISADFQSVHFWEWLKCAKL